MTIYKRTTADGPVFRPSQLLITSFNSTEAKFQDEASRKYAYLMSPSGDETGVTAHNAELNDEDSPVFGFARMADFDGLFFEFSKFAYWDREDDHFEIWVNQYTGYNFAIAGSGTWHWKAEYWRPVDPTNRYGPREKISEEEGDVTLVFDGTTEGDGTKQSVGTIPSPPPRHFNDTVFVHFGLQCKDFEYDTPISEIFQ